MSLFRPNPITGDWVVLAPERSRRPNAFLEAADLQRAEECPFCPGNEEMTPPEILRVGADRWRLRLFPNKYPASSETSAFDAPGRHAAAPGHHEVLVESDDHAATIDRLPLHEMAAAVEIYRDRYASLTTRDGGYVAIFKNDGRAAGASISHIHSQIVSVPFAPGRLREEEEGFGRASCCPFCSPEAVGEAIGSGEHFRWVAPAASAMPYQQWIIPLTHSPNMSSLADPAIRELAALLGRSVAAMRRLSADLAYNWMFLNFGAPSCHWYVEIVPRLTALAGFELGTGSGIQIVDPLRAAKELSRGT